MDIQPSADRNSQSIELLVGSYGNEDEPTLHRVSFDCSTGALQLLGAQNGLSNPSYLAVVDGGNTVLAVAENTDDTAALTMLRRSEDDTFIRVATRQLPGAGPCHVAVSPDGRRAITSNYTAGSISIMDFDSEKGTLGAPVDVQFHGKGADARRQASPHAHFTTFSPDGRLMLTADLGSDTLHTIALDYQGMPQPSTLRHIRMAAGSGPRHITFAKDGVTAYLINEIDGTVTRLTYNPDTQGLNVHESVLADFEHGHGSADIRLSADGRKLYVSNRLKGDGIAVFDISAADGHLTPTGFIPTGKHPRNFIVSPDGSWLIVAVRDDNRLECYPLDLNTGMPGQMQATLSIPRPVCIVPLSEK